ncbi:ubiquitin-conjugating enzyme E2 R1, partial [Papio anubis]|uniref:ubiquitin-conjugating enzyme E2 R1 n=1 Tax=Papio anubis TaxID=9555 RepID=UPI0012AE033A
GIIRFSGFPGEGASRHLPQGQSSEASVETRGGATTHRGSPFPVCLGGSWGSVEIQELLSAQGHRCCPATACSRCSFRSQSEPWGRGHQREPSTVDLPCGLGGGFASRSLGLLRVKDIIGGAENKRLVGTWQGSVQARLKFPIDYPYSPPAFRFLTKMWHPNIYETGDVCISILHPPVDDPQSGELPSERWNPTQNVRTILLSVISLLNEPNTFSPANVDASVMYRKWKESKGKDREYTTSPLVRKQVLGTKVDAERDGVKVPTTLAEYCVKTKAPAPDEGSDLFYDDYYEDGEGGEEADSCFGDDEDDSGTEES